MFGYARVSSRDQNLDRQMDALLAFGVEPQMVFADKASGKDFHRPAYAQMLGELAEGDIVVLKSIDRLGRNYSETMDQWRLLTKELKVDVVVLDMPLLDTRTRENGLTGEFISDLVLQLLSYISQLERDNIKARQAEGIASARARGAKFGRPRKPRPSGYSEVARAYRAGEGSLSMLAKTLGVSRSTFRRWLLEDDCKS